MIRRTPRVKETMVRILALAIKFLNTPDLPLVSSPHRPTDLARFLETCASLLSADGRLQEKSYVLDDLQLAANYLCHPKVARHPVPQGALTPLELASYLREMVRDLK